MLLFVIAGCSGGGDPGISLTCRVNDRGVGFSNADNPTLEIIGNQYGDPYDDEVTIFSRRIDSDDTTTSDYAAKFGFKLDVPDDNVLDNGVGVFKVGVSEYYTQFLWIEHYDQHVLVYAKESSTSEYVGWTVWDIDTTDYERAAENTTMTITTDFWGRGRTATAKEQVYVDPVTRARLAARPQEEKIKAIHAAISGK